MLHKARTCLADVVDIVDRMLSTVTPKLFAVVVTGTVASASCTTGLPLWEVGR